jgi:hypothetical protein
MSAGRRAARNGAGLRETVFRCAGGKGAFDGGIDHHRIAMRASPSAAAIRPRAASA